MARYEKTSLDKLRNEICFIAATLVHILFLWTKHQYVVSFAFC